ncbi:hypothetical protein [Mesorhizobium sp. B3-1-6]
MTSGSSLAEAAGCAHSRWEGLTRFLRDGRTRSTLTR